MRKTCGHFVPCAGGILLPICYPISISTHLPELPSAKDRSPLGLYAITIMLYKEFTNVSRGGITSDTALRLARYFGTSAQIWFNLQARHDLEMAEDSLKERIERDVSPHTAA